jgi:hypothetical protein
LYCFTDERPLCLKCTEPPTSNEDPGNFYETHGTHYVKSLTSVLESADKEKELLKSQIQNELDKIASAIEYFGGVEDILMN